MAETRCNTRNNVMSEVTLKKKKKQYKPDTVEINARVKNHWTIVFLSVKAGMQRHGIGWEMGVGRGGEGGRCCSSLLLP